MELLAWVWFLVGIGLISASFWLTDQSFSNWYFAGFYFTPTLRTGHLDDEQFAKLLCGLCMLPVGIILALTMFSRIFVSCRNHVLISSLFSFIFGSICFVAGSYLFLLRNGWSFITWNNQTFIYGAQSQQGIYALLLGLTMFILSIYLMINLFKYRSYYSRNDKISSDSSYSINAIKNDLVEDRNRWMENNDARIPIININNAENINNDFNSLLKQNNGDYAGIGKICLFFCVIIPLLLIMSGFNCSDWHHMTPAYTTKELKLKSEGQWITNIKYSYNNNIYYFKLYWPLAIVYFFVISVSLFCYFARKNVCVLQKLPTKNNGCVAI